MNSEIDWFIYILDPNLLYENIGNISEERLVKLMRMLLFHAERHDLRNMNSISNDRPESNDIPITYDKARTLDRLASMIASHFRLNVNIFSGTVSEVPLTLTVRIYRCLISSFSRRDNQLGKSIIWVNSAFYDIGHWNDMSPTLAYAAFAYHLWALQVVILNNMIPQPSRNQTPSVCGLSELPDGSFLSSNATLRKDMYKNHLVVVQHLHDLLCHGLDNQGRPLSFQRPASVDFVQNAIETNQHSEVLSINYIISAIAFILGRLAIQKNLRSRANEFFLLAKEKMIAEQLEYVEEVGLVPQLIDAYLTCCRQDKIHLVKEEFHMDSFCSLLDQNLSLDISKFDLSLISSHCSLRRNAFSLTAIITFLEADCASSSDSTLGFGLRKLLRQLMDRVMNILSTDHNSKMITSQLERDSKSWYSLYIRERVNSGLYWIRKCALENTLAFSDYIISIIDTGTSFTDIFVELSQYAVNETEIANFMKQLVDLIIMNWPVIKSTKGAARLIKLMEISCEKAHLPIDARTALRNKLESKSSRSSTSVIDLFTDLPDVNAEENSFPSAFSQKITTKNTLELGRDICDTSYLMSSDPKMVLKSCTDLLMIGASVETIFRFSGWLDSALPIFLKWSTRDPQVKHRRDANFMNNCSSLHDFLTAVSENINCAPSLILLLRAVEYRRDRMDFEAAKAFLSLSECNRPAPEMKQDSAFSGNGVVPFWRRSLLRWLYEMIEEEKTVLAILDAIFTLSTHRQNSSAEVLVQQCKCILIEDVGPDRIVSDDLLACAACLLLIKDPQFLVDYKGRLFVPSLISQMLNLSTEKLNFTKAAYNICLNFLQPWLKSTWDGFLSHFQNTPSFSPSKGSHNAFCTGLISFTIRLLAHSNFSEGHVIFDSFINCLTVYMSNVSKIEPTMDFNPLSKVIMKKPYSQVVVDILQFALTCGLESNVNNTNYLLAQTHLQSTIQPNNPRLAMTLILQAAAIESNYFSRHVPSNILTLQALETLIFGCQSMGYIGEALVLCQFEDKVHIPIGLQILESAASVPSNFSAYDSLESMTVYLWDLQLLEALCKFQQFNQALSKNISSLRCINQLELNTANIKKSNKMAIRKRQKEFLRYLSLKLLSV